MKRPYNIRGIIVEADTRDEAVAAVAAIDRPHDHRYEAGAYGVCRRCGDEYVEHVKDGTD